MSTKFIDISVGTRFGRLQTISEPYKKQGKNIYYVDCICDCGNLITVQKRSLTSKQIKSQTRSCGCLQRDVASRLKTQVCSGVRFGRLVVVEDLGVVSGRRKIKCLCDCGKYCVVRYEALVSGHTLSCGCYHSGRVSESQFKHGLTGTPTHDSWTSMKQRCANPKDPSFEEYGGRGISYDPRWEDFTNFLEDMGVAPEGTTLDRIDFNGNYTKENCRWAIGAVQIHNQRKRRSNGKRVITSEFKGVYYDKSRDKWQCRLQYRREPVINKRFTTEIEAAIAYDKVSLEVYGDEPNKELIEQYKRSGGK